MKIRVIKTELTQFEKYQALTVSYRNLDSGKVASAKVLDFKSPAVFEALKGAAVDSVWDVKVVPEDFKGKTIFVWTGAVAGEAPVAEASAAAPPARKAGYSSDREWETKAERFMRQFLIIRQSCLGHALEYFQENTATVEEILATAEAFEDWVWRDLDVKKQNAGFNVADAMKALLEMKDDIPA